jgi:AcrR family transcriptional regulator
MPRGFTENEKTLIREQLLSEGYKQFSAYGLRKTTIGGLASAVNISTGAFYLFYESKEALFMDVVELAEQRFRQEMLAVLERPGPSPRARMFAIFKSAFDLLKTTPILQFFSGSDFDVLFRRVPPDKLREHLASDKLFFRELFIRCQDAGIPIAVQPEEAVELMYPLVLSVMHADDFGQMDIGGGIDRLLELLAAYFLGEVDLQLQEPFFAASAADQGNYA